jgi:hypothetical protein
MEFDRMCFTNGCKKEAVGFVGKFGETRTTGTPVNTPPGQRISINFCAEHEEHTKLVLKAL